MALPLSQLLSNVEVSVPEVSYHDTDQLSPSIEN